MKEIYRRLFVTIIVEENFTSIVRNNYRAERFISLLFLHKFSQNLRQDVILWLLKYFRTAGNFFRKV